MLSRLVNCRTIAIPASNWKRETWNSDYAFSASPQKLRVVIREVIQRPVTNVKEFERATRQGRRGDRILLLVQRGDNAVFFAVKRKG